MTHRIIRPCGLVVRKQRLLVLRYQYGSHTRFNLPGGNLESNETIHTCLIREFNEELNLTVVPGDLIFVAETKTDEKNTLHLAFELTCQGEPTLNLDAVKAQELLWLEPDVVDSAPLYPAIGSVLGSWLRGTLPTRHFLGPIEQPWFH